MTCRPDSQLSHFYLVDVSEAQVLLIGKIVPSPDHSIIPGLGDSLCGQFITSHVLATKVPSERDNNDNQEGVASKMGGKGDEVLRAVPGEENLGSFIGLARCSATKWWGAYRWHFQRPR